MVIFQYIIIAVVVGGAIILKRWYNSPKYKGKKGEKRIHNILMQLPDYYVILDDIVLKTNRGTTQIDHIIVSRYGVFAIETKNYRGDIYGDDNRKEWTQLIVTEVTYAKKWWKTYTYVTKNHFYNPVKQSVSHALRIKEVVVNAYPNLKVIPIVVFTGNVNLSNIVSKYQVIYEESLLEVIQGYKAISMTDADVQKIVCTLVSNNVRPAVNDRQHVKNLRLAAQEVRTTIISGICPKCGGHLVERNGKYGTFYGCSNYPNCRFTTK